MMSNEYAKNASNRISESVSFSSDLLLYVKGAPFNLRKETLANKSAKVTELLERNALEELRWLLRDIEADPGTFQLIARFCYGYEVQLSSDNIVSVICLAYYLGMNEDHSSNNLLNKAAEFLKERVLPSWNETVKALHVSEHILNQVEEIGLLNVFLDSLVEKAVNDPRLLGEPIRQNNSEPEGENGGDGYRPNARKRLFVPDRNSEDLISVPLQLYEPLIRAMDAQNVPLENLVSSICKYAKRWVFEEIPGDKNMSLNKRECRRNAIEVVEQLLPHQRGLIPCTFLIELLKQSILLEASSSCRDGFESRIGKQLDMATAKDLLMLSRGYAEEPEYDVELLRRILSKFYSNYEELDLVNVAKLMEEFLAEAASDGGLRIKTFVLMAELSVAASLLRYSDGIYRAIDIFLESHKHLTESERLEACKVLDCKKLSPEACEHASKNEKLPMRIVVQVLFVSLLQIRETVAKEMKNLAQNSKEVDEEHEAEEEGEEEEAEEEDEGEEEEERIGFSGDINDDDDDDDMSNELMILENECDYMKNEIERDCVMHCGKKKSKKISIWSEVKRKFGCMSSVDACSCHDKKMMKKKKKIHHK